MVDFPDRASESWNFLTERECQFIIRRVMRDRGDAEVPPFDFWSWAAAGRDWKVWAFGFSFFLNATVAYAISFFMPIILKQKMEFSLAASQCLVAPPYVLAAIQMYLLSVVGDRWHVRGPIILFNNVVSLVGVPLMVSVLKSDISAETVLNNPRDMQAAMQLDMQESSSSLPALFPTFRL